MKKLLAISCGLLLSGCALERAAPPAAAGPLDSVIRATPALSTGKVKFNGPVTLQIGGTGNTASATTVAKAKAPVAAAPAAAATDASQKTSGLPWWQVVVLGLAGGFLVAGYYRFK